jgi:predicted CoA-substrate-specific enzyme activase
MNGNGDVLSYEVVETRPDIDQMAEDLWGMALKKANLSPEDICYTVSTGYGRNTVSFAQENRTEILCHAEGIHALFPSVRTIIDIGGQDSKVIRLDETGRVVNFTMNTKCAAGTGRFTEVMARALKIELHRWGDVVASAEKRAKISNICTVFAESEVISKLMQKVPLNEILAGVCEAIASRVYESVQRMGGGKPDVAFTGGVANNQGVTQMLEEKIGLKLMIPKIPQSTGALGAACLARKLYYKSKAMSG